MKILGFKLFGRSSNEEIDAFARGLSAQLAEQVPPDTQPQALKDKKSERNLGKSLNRVLSQARDFQAEHRLGVYGRARVANTFKWELRELGYDDEFVEETTKALVLSLN